ncbi:LuxR C-terminal-related transcriptional regulator [Legionella sp.]|uniref:helix-turn-helix transcriptional regulator n=1 Tax=Legionella sp. TaxID=459 RepID=UPI003220010B
MDGALVGTLGIALSFQEKSVNEFLQEILKITSILNICIKHELMIRLITQIMHLNSVQKGLKLENQFFDYGHVVFSYREAQCLHYFLNHYSAQKTSEKLFISPKKVEFHLAKIKEKLNCYDTYQITQLAVNYGFIDLMFMRF